MGSEFTWRWLFFFYTPVWLFAAFGFLGHEARRQHEVMPWWMLALCVVSACLQLLTIIKGYVEWFSGSA